MLHDSGLFQMLVFGIGFPILAVTVVDQRAEARRRRADAAANAEILERRRALDARRKKAA